MTSSHTWRNVDIHFDSSEFLVYSYIVSLNFSETIDVEKLLHTEEGMEDNKNMDGI